ncbi:hypothetical protein EXU48_18270 [Occultella glacieicola]|uniref:Uncharacterized protein n=1 Tax=Occultella glacieicola TaxID=2518684 RepID=A0ABY2DZT2_9MICO|nr:hypothetical protein [Occultella glacieicola]TDE90396.1 hypothetical protein EXU48_18270 [Occultella glacieicola]
MVTEGFTAELVAVVPWDDEHTGVTSSFTDHPAHSWRVPEHTRRARSPVRLRLDRDGGFHLLGDDPSVLHLDGTGTPVGRTPVAGRILDYVCDPAGGVVLIEGADDEPRLRALAGDGSERWSVGGRFTKVLATGDRLYVHGDPGTLEVDPTTGAAGPILPVRGGEPFGGGGKLVSVTFDDASQRRGVAVFDPATGESTEFTGGADHYPWLVDPFGADGRARLFVWWDGRIARVPVTGEIDALGAVDGIAVRDRTVFTSHGAGEHVVVQGNGMQARLPVAGLRLVGVDADSRVYLLGGEGPGSAGELRVYAADGHLESSGPPPEDLAAIGSRMPVHTAWQVDHEGRVTIPVGTPGGVALVRLRSAGTPIGSPPGRTT